MLDPKQLRDLVVMPVLQQLDLPSDAPSKGAAAMELLMGTAMQESQLVYIHQLGGGPAVGLWQMEPATFLWLAGWVNQRPSLLAKVMGYSIGISPQVNQLAGNVYLACAMARLRYYVVPEALPGQGDAEAQARYYKAHYNTPAGAATVEEYLANRAIVMRLLA